MTTITETKTATAPVAQGFIAFAGIVVRRLREFVRAAKHRHDIATLAGLDDRMLADIGLTRGDLRDAISEPLWRDPTMVLTSRVRERRVNRWRFGLVQAQQEEFPAPSIVPAVSAYPAIGITIYR